MRKVRKIKEGGRRGLRRAKISPERPFKGRWRRCQKYKSKPVLPNSGCEPLSICSKPARWSYGAGVTEGGATESVLPTKSSDALLRIAGATGCKTNLRFLVFKELPTDSASPSACSWERRPPHTALGTNLGSSSRGLLSDMGRSINVTHPIIG